jgi:hypothetical protein
MDAVNATDTYRQPFDMTFEKLAWENGQDDQLELATSPTIVGAGEINGRP